MNNENPFKKGSLASRFYAIDKFFSKPSIKNSSSFAKGTFGILYPILVGILEIVFIFIKLIFQILWIISLGMLISSFFSR